MTLGGAERAAAVVATLTSPQLTAFTLVGRWWMGLSVGVAAATFLPAAEEVASYAGEAAAACGPDRAGVNIAKRLRKASRKGPPRMRVVNLEGNPTGREGWGAGGTTPEVPAVGGAGRGGADDADLADADAEATVAESAAAEAAAGAAVVVWWRRSGDGEVDRGAAMISTLATLPAE